MVYLRCKIRRECGIGYRRKVPQIRRKTIFRMALFFATNRVFEKTKTQYFQRFATIDGVLLFALHPSKR